MSVLDLFKFNLFSPKEHDDVAVSFFKGPRFKFKDHFVIAEWVIRTLATDRSFKRIFSASVQPYFCAVTCTQQFYKVSVFQMDLMEASQDPATEFPTEDGFIHVYVRNRGKRRDPYLTLRPLKDGPLDYKIDSSQPLVNVHVDYDEDDYNIIVTNAFAVVLE